MSRGLSQLQREILQLIAEAGGEFKYDELYPAIYPELYEARGEKRVFGKSLYREVKEYGKAKAEKNTARVVLYKSVERLIKRGLLKKRWTGRYYELNKL